MSATQMTSKTFLFSIQIFKTKVSVACIITIKLSRNRQPKNAKFASGVGVSWVRVSAHSFTVGLVLVPYLCNSDRSDIFTVGCRPCTAP